MPTQPEFQRRLQKIEGLVGKIEATADPSLRTMVQELVQLVMELHGAGVERMLKLIREAGGEGESVIEKLGRDELVASILVLYGLHPAGLEERVAQALKEARRRLRAHEGEVELLSIQDGAVRLRLRANGHGCGSTAQALKEIVEESVYETAPDIAALVIEDAGEKQGFVPLERLQGMAPAPPLSNGLAAMAGEKGAV